MRAALALLCCSCVSTPSARTPVRPSEVAADAQFVQGKAVIRDAHCGGAATTPEASDKLRRPAASLTLRLYVGRENLAAPATAVLQTDAQGRFEAWLKPDTYCVVLSTRSREFGSLPAPPESLAGHPSTPECLKALEARCDGELVVGERQKEVWADLAGKTCAWNSPCAVQPPSAAPVPPPVP